MYMECGKRTLLGRENMCRIIHVHTYGLGLQIRNYNVPQVQAQLQKYKPITLANLVLHVLSIYVHDIVLALISYMIITYGANV